MALQTVLKNICSFLEILDASRSPQVALWDETSLRNAFEWAAYCQQIYNQSKGKSYSVHLDQEVRKIGEMLMMQQKKTATYRSSSSVTEIGLEMLKQSSSLLVASLLGNVHLKRETLAVLFSDALPGVTATHVMPECCRLIQSKAVFKLLSAISNDLVHPSASGSSACDLDPLSQSKTMDSFQSKTMDSFQSKTMDSFHSKTMDSFGCSSSASKLRNCGDLTVLCLTQLLLRFLRNTLQNDSQVSERKKIQSMLMEKFGQTDLGQVVLMTSFLNRKSSGIRSVDSCVINNVLEECLKLLVNQNDTSFISSFLLINVCNRSFQVYSHFIKHLVRCCEKLRPVYGTYPVSHPHQLVTWRPHPAPANNSKGCLGYEEVKHCFALLLSRGSHQVVAATDRLLRLLAQRQKTTSAIWTTILNDLRPMNVVCS